MDRTKAHEGNEAEQACAQALHELYSELSPADCMRVAQVCSLRVLAAGSNVYLQGAPATDAALLLRGGLRAFARTRADEQALNLVRRGEFFGEAALFATSTVRAATVRAMSASEILVIPPQAVEALSGTRFLAILQRTLLESTAKRLRTNRLAIRRHWQVASAPEPKSSDVNAPKESQSAPRTASWWETLRSSLASLA